jgi:glycosyltransferase involved in cell wall biosynthesis
MKIHLLEAFFSGSHKSWAEAYQKYSQHEVDILSLPGRHWKWRMHGAAITLAQQYLNSSKQADLLLATDLLDLNIFLSLTRSQTNGIPTAFYFHENQLTYPWSPTDPDVALKRDNHYAFIQYASALAADQLFFNSAYHQHSFLSHLPDFLKQFPDFKTLDQLPALEAKSQVLPLGLDLSYLDGFKTDRLEGPPVLLWNHRWEYDKNPEAFYEALVKLVADHIDFRLIILGESFPKSPPAFKKIQQEFYKQILHFGYAADKADYAKFLWQADIIPVTSYQDFFGGSVVEAIYADCIPLLPKRLAYGEHIPEALHAKYMYQSEEEFYPRLKALLLNFKNHKPDAELKQLVKRYNWRNLAPRYDAVFATMDK